MSIDALLTPKEINLPEEVQEFATSILRQLLLDMDAEKVNYPREYIQEAGAKNLLGLRFASEWGGRNMPWTSELVALEEIGVLGTSLICLHSLVSIVGEAIHVFGTTDQKENYLKSMLTGQLTVAEGLLSPIIGSLRICV